MIIKDLESKAAHIRRQVLAMIVSANKGHIGGAFSCVEILVALYYGEVLRVNPFNPRWEKRDRFILSKGHSCSALFAILADRGFIDQEVLAGYGKNNAMLGGHPDRRVPGIEVDTGSLGHGLGVGAGMALSARMNGEDHRVVVLLGDGECCEGSVWEALLFASHHHLGNLVLIIDRNSQCVLDYTENCTSLDALAAKLQAFGCETKEVDGHSFEDLLAQFSGLSRRSSSRPLAIVAKTIKGKGVSFMEGSLQWHHAVPAGEQLARAAEELEAQCAAGMK